MPISRVTFYIHLTIVWAAIALATWPAQTGHRDYTLTFFSWVICVVQVILFLRSAWLAIDIPGRDSRKFS